MEELKNGDEGGHFIQKSSCSHVHNQPSCKDRIVLDVPKHEPGIPGCLNLVGGRLRREMGEMGYNTYEQPL